MAWAVAVEPQRLSRRPAWRGLCRYPKLGWPPEHWAIRMEYASSSAWQKYLVRGVDERSFFDIRW